MHVHYVLISDGSSDRALMPILSWLLDRPGITSIRAEWSDPWPLKPSRKKIRLHERIRRTLDIHDNCNLLFVHRDAEGEAPSRRAEEIRAALQQAHAQTVAVCVIPVRMQEAWLLFDEAALRTAAGNPNGRVPLRMPRLSTLEELPDPKSCLHDLLRTACALSRRRLKDFDPHSRAYRLAGLIRDFSPLRQLPAFNALEDELTAALAQLR